MNELKKLYLDNFSFDNSVNSAAASLKKKATKPFIPRKLNWSEKKSRAIFSWVKMNYKRAPLMQTKSQLENDEAGAHNKNAIRPKIGSLRKLSSAVCMQQFGFSRLIRFALGVFVCTTPYLAASLKKSTHKLAARKKVILLFRSKGLQRSTLERSIFHSGGGNGAAEWRTG